MAKAERLYVQHKERLVGGASNLRGTSGYGGASDGMNNYIPGWSEKSPRTQADQLIEFLNSELR